MSRLIYIFILPFLLISGCNTIPPIQQVELNKDAVLTAEKYRPLYHFTPPEQWMNDPNGMVYHDGEYHLFYQYHPDSTIWGPMHWGHAISEDMLNWQHMPIAIYPDELGTIFSGSAVVDVNNTSGLGSLENPAMVAIYTYHKVEREQAGFDDFQSQGIAYSLDNGRSWTKYANNPVLKNPGLKVYRDPKVSWYAPQKKWIMALAQGDHIGFYSSKNLIDWKTESTFGQSFGEHGGVWECPDLIELKVQGSETSKHVLLVSIFPGGPNGGAATQYFVGDFNGNEFVLDADFSSQLQQTPEFFPSGDVFEDFENDFSNWQVTGTAFGTSPSEAGYEGQNEVRGFADNRLANSFNHGDETVGNLISKPFEIERSHINFYIGGGRHSESTAINLVIDGKVVRSASGDDRDVLHIASWDVSEFIGASATIEIVDSETGGWGHILVDQIVFADEAAHERIEPAKWIDYGTDNYAGVTFSNIPETDGRALFMGWMNNWFYANEVPTEKWRGAMSVPRKLTLNHGNNGYQVFSTPIKEINEIVKTSHELGDKKVNKYMDLTPLLPTITASNRLQFDVVVNNSKTFELIYSNTLNNKLSVKLDVDNGQVELDRTQSGNVDFQKDFASKQLAPISHNLPQYSVDVFYDQSSIEIFINQGELVMTSLVFPEIPFNKIEVLSDQGVLLKSLKLSNLESEFMASKE